MSSCLTASTATPSSATVIRQLEAGLPAHVARAMWRGQDLGGAQGDTVPSGFAELDAELPGGGWPGQSLIEILQPVHHQAEWRLLSPAVAGLLQQGARLLLIGPPYTPGLQGLVPEGVRPQQLVWVQAHTAAERLWAAEQALKAECLSVILLWLPQARPEQLRRLQACAGRHAGLCFVIRPLAAQADASAAPLRLRLELGAWPVPMQVQVLKRRGPLHTRPIVLARWPAGLRPLLPVALPTVAPPGPRPGVPMHRPVPAASPIVSRPALPLAHALLDRPDSLGFAEHSALAGSAASQP